MAINEEAMSVNEEFQSTNEELETSKEELQSLNEELTALNSQLQETLEHQRATSNDLHNMLDSSGVATLFLDGDLKIRFFTPAAKLAVQRHRLGHRPAARRPGPPHQRPAVCSPTPRRCSPAALPPNREVEADNGAWYTRRILPYRTQDDRSRGWSSPSPTSPRGRRPNGRSRRRGPIPTASSIPSANRSSCSTRSFASSPPAAPSTTPSRVEPEKTVGRRLDAVDDGRLDNRGGCAIFLDRLRKRRAGHRGSSRSTSICPPRGRAALLAQCPGDPRRSLRRAARSC